MTCAQACADDALDWVATSKDISWGGPVNPPSTPAWSVGSNVPSRNRSQLSCESWVAKIVQPPSDGPAAWYVCPGGRPPSGCTAARTASYCDWVPPGK